jgi:hypothetical protein
MNQTNPLTAASKQTCARLPVPQAAWYDQIHATGGVSGAITMVVVFVGCLYCCGLTRDVSSLLYVKMVQKAL